MMINNQNNQPSNQNSQKILILTEKPSQGKVIAKSLGFNTKKETIAISKKDVNVEIHEGMYNNQEYIIIPAKGHLLSLRGKSASLLYFGFEWLPETALRKDLLARYKLIKDYSKNISQFIIATDYDDEGELIGYNIARDLKLEKITKRMVYHAMTPKEIKNALLPGNLANVRIPVVNAADIRTWLDKSFGRNFSKILTQAYKQATNSTQYVQLPVGRVMTPILSKIIERINDIEKAKKALKTQKPKINIGFNIKASVQHINDQIDLSDYINEKTYPVSIETARELLGKYRNKNVTVKDTKIEKKSYTFNAGLTIDAVRSWGHDNGFEYTRIDAILESLYLNGVITYPRTESTILPCPSKKDDPLHENVNDDYHVEKVNALLELYELPDDIVINNVEPLCGDEYDNAHWAIHPTGYEAYIEDGVTDDEAKEKFFNFINKLPFDYKTVYDYIACNYLKGFARKYVIENHYMTLEFLKSEFDEKYFKKVLDYGYKIIDNVSLLNYDTNEDIDVPEIDLGEEYPVSTSIEKYVIKPDIPERLTQADIFNYMRIYDLGTDATRTFILEKLWKNNLLRGDPPIPTLLGLRLFGAIKQINEELTSPDLTRRFNEYKDDIMNENITIKEVQNLFTKEITELAQEKIKDLQEIGESIAFFGTCLECGKRMKLISIQKQNESIFFLACEDMECGFTSSI